MSKKDKVRGLILLAVLPLLLFFYTKSILMTIGMLGGLFIVFLVVVFPILFLLDRSKRSLKGFLRDALRDDDKK